MVNPRVFFDIAVDNNPVGRIIFELFSETAPKTCENFRALCTGEKGLSPISERPLYYKGSIVHRAIKDFMIQGGDFTKRNGMGGESIYGCPFADEDLTRPLDAKGLLCMANKGPNTNGSQFFITLRECPHLNGKHVVFGRVIRGYDDVVTKITEVQTDEKDRPIVPITIANCGELVMKSKVQPKEEVKESEEESEDESDRDREKRKKRRHRHRSRSRSPASDASSDDEDRSRHRKRRSKKSKGKHGKDKARSASPERSKEPEEETEEQYDARLEREEKERIEAARRKELERIKRSAENVVTKDGVRFKGRGRMKYIDPELHR
ncbi:cyclophilin-like domain-containing protein [Cristinia sonorae]|uniref:Peptidyl-prolyl cis-trans isomerase D n=1 Tax=Cristinia sonorae TaxID=1940300 RepID=A0A8K0UJC2_9AGAR|nr:cyclophilin-like domain-containing protein [Cristinia sonorae]